MCVGQSLVSSFVALVEAVRSQSQHSSSSVTNGQLWCSSTQHTRVEICMEGLVQEFGESSNVVEVAASTTIASAALGGRGGCEGSDDDSAKTGETKTRPRKENDYFEEAVAEVALEEICCGVFEEPTFKLVEKCVIPPTPDAHQDVQDISIQSVDDCVVKSCRSWKSHQMSETIVSHFSSFVARQVHSQVSSRASQEGGQFFDQTSSDWNLEINSSCKHAQQEGGNCVVVTLSKGCGYGALEAMGHSTKTNQVDPSSTIKAYSSCQSKDPFLWALDATHGTMS